MSYLAVSNIIEDDLTASRLGNLERNIATYPATLGAANEVPVKLKFEVDIGIPSIAKAPLGKGSVPLATINLDATAESVPAVFE